jgi:primosomal protein DnaI
MVKFVRGIRKKGLFICGNPGVGKTYLLTRLADTLANNNRKVAFISVINLISHVKEPFTGIFNESSLVDTF